MTVECPALEVEERLLRAFQICLPSEKSRSSPRSGACSRHAKAATPPKSEITDPKLARRDLCGLKLPLLGISGTEDRQHNGLTAANRREAFALWPQGPHKFIWLANAKHLDFTDSTGVERRATPSPTREDVQPLVRAVTLLFFNSYLKADTNASKQLTSDALKPYLHGAVNNVDVLSK